MIAAAPFLLVYATAATLLVGLAIGGWATFLTPLVVFVGLPLADHLAGLDTGETSEEGAVNPWFDAILRAWPPFQIGILALVVRHVTTAAVSPVEWAGLLLSTALVTSGAGITIAHELMHRKSAFDRGLAEILMGLASYPHFCIEHVHGHHRNVATRADPATSRLGESVYAFLPRTVAGSLASAVHIERGRIARREIPWYSGRNRLLRYPTTMAATYAAVGFTFGWAGLAFYILQGVLAFGLLEVINYVEHYGLSRDPAERVAPRHSWNANHRISNWWLFNLQRHADHHAHAARPYWKLRALEQGPQLPFSYPTLILMALVPPLWRAVMDPCVLASRR